jgi:RNA polymerase sigma-32 factor
LKQFKKVNEKADILESTDTEVEPEADGVELIATPVEVLDTVPEVAEVEEDAASASSTDLVRYDPLNRYLAEIRHFPPLSREEEHELAVRYKEEGDQMAGYRLVMANLRLVVMIAREYQRNAKNILDLVQEGNIGLLEAVKQFDPYRGVRFPSYAVYWVRAYMLRYIINNLRLVKIGTTQAQRKLFFNLRKEKERLEAEGFVPEAKLLAKRLNVKESEVIEMQQRLELPDLSVDAPLGMEDDGADMHSLLPDPGDSVEDSILDMQFSEAIRDAVEGFRKDLDDKQQAILDRRLFTSEPVTLQIIADEFGLSRERIRQIESKLKLELKSFLADTLSLGSEGQVVIVDSDPVN